MSNQVVSDNFKNCEILCYHRIVDNDTPDGLYPNDGLSISIKNFEKHLNYFLKKYKIVDLKNNDSDNAKNARIKILITFDDGYKDIIKLVIPVIEKKKVPIVVFLSTELIENNREFCWWIDLWLNLKGKEIISLTFNDHSKTFRLDTYTRKIKCYEYLSHLLINIKRKDQLAFFLKNNLEINNIKDFLTTEDIKELSSNPLVTFGFHSNYHLNYRVESTEVIEDDIKKMHLFFDKYSIIPDKKMLAFCYGKYPGSFLKFRYFDYFFALGYRALLTKHKHFVTSRINVNNKNNLLILTLRIYSFRIFKLISKYF